MRIPLEGDGDGEVWGLPPGEATGPCCAGVDVRPGSWDVVILEVTGPGQRRLVAAGKLVDERAVLQVLRRYRVFSVVADTRPETMLVCRLQEMALRAGLRFWRAQYTPSGSDVPLKEDPGGTLLRLDRTYWLDRVLDQVRQGGLRLPANWGAILGGQFAEEMTTGVRTLRQGQFVWVGEPTHAMHAAAYALVAQEHARVGPRARVQVAPAPPDDADGDGLLLES